MHRTFEPKILYLGTPVVLISTVNEDGTANLAPMSSAWWLGMSCVLGLGTRSKTFENLRRTEECVLNLPSSEMVAAVDRLALTTGKSPVPDSKTRMGFRHVADKFGLAGLTGEASDSVRPPRVAECPVQLEAVVENIHRLGAPENHHASIEVRVVSVHADENILDGEKRHHFDTDKWRPLIMSFCEFYELGGRVHPSRLAKVF